MSNSKMKDQKIHRYPPFEIVVNGKTQTVRAGTQEELRPHIDRVWHRFLEVLDFNPLAPNPFECESNRSDQKLWGLLCSRSYVNNDRPLTRSELLAARDRYLARLGMGDEPWSDNLTGSYWIPAQTKN